MEGTSKVVAVDVIMTEQTKNIFLKIETVVFPEGLDVKGRKERDINMVLFIIFIYYFILAAINLD